MEAVQMEPERLWRKGFVKQMSFKCKVKGQGSEVTDGESKGGDWGL